MKGTNFKVITILIALSLAGCSGSDKSDKDDIQPIPPAPDAGTLDSEKWGVNWGELIFQPGNRTDGESISSETWVPLENGEKADVGLLNSNFQNLNQDISSTCIEQGQGESRKVIPITYSHIPAEVGSPVTIGDLSASMISIPIHDESGNIIFSVEVPHTDNAETSYLLTRNVSKCPSFKIGSYSATVVDSILYGASNIASTESTAIYLSSQGFKYFIWLTDTLVFTSSVRWNQNHVAMMPSVASYDFGSSPIMRTTLFDPHEQAALVKMAAKEFVNHISISQH